ncbi:LLM class flavin-dependent oxidoreductase [Kibdelosporangium phytohabitans]|uniref:FAD-linked oxidase n=1 Tax=Kibdelosporangium phytohabitans TaxID=860235 RepID=A0A0N9I2P9_9PSEU|nr:LLM class flavin-dependent oxidoreductase [Kibdelosporangium phytohabitans]ALG08747.1 FAD-linked oxidase [Kibdelosporangium phytohabitans]MBE1470136.1 alkanesulfonate monooxygenase SsuD/methylene tetrahydromethanopterin reductase-like flavin-dependent oxidoreductase (luciferase family) [Kibdelosporangium phytohabitans]
MTDYGHDLVLGTFITPSAKDPARAVGLAELTEAAGLDAATFQDHPYNAGLLDVWTLLSWVAARTNRITVSGNVINLPLRPPAVLATAAASLDLLSGGRFELGIGAGGFGDAIHGMGGGSKSAGQRIEALSEAIDIFRGLWDAGTRGMFRYDGRHYQVPGVKRGPAPQHDIGIWLGAYKPKMLALTGAKADGWLPTLEYLKPGDLAAGNAAIDEAAATAGRDPRTVRRLLNIMGASFDRSDTALHGTPADWVEQLLELVLEHGVSAFFIGGDDARTIQAFGAEVAPALRAAVADERGTSQRVAGIDYDALPRELQVRSVGPGDRGYERVRHTYSYKGSPGLVIQPGNAEEVATALTYARAQQVTISVRSGGHGISGRSTNDGGIVIDLARLNKVSVLDRATRRVRVEPGARWGEVAEALAPHGLAVSSGDYGGVGVGGLATTGGLGYLARSYGLTIDHVLAVDIVLADGTALRADETHHPDLFWAVRGAGGNFGIVTAFEIEATEITDVVHASLVIDAAEAAGVLQRWGKLVEDAPREVTSFLALLPARRGQPPIAHVTLVYAGSDIPAAQAALSPFLGTGPVLREQAQVMPYAAALHTADNTHHGHGLSDSRSGLVEHITPEVAAAVEKIITSSHVLIAQFRSAGGAVNDTPADATAYAHRTQNFSVLAATAPSRARQLDTVWSELYPLLNGMYLSFETDTSPDRLLDAFPDRTLCRLLTLKAKYDPDGVFDKNFDLTAARKLPVPKEG